MNLRFDTETVLAMVAGTMLLLFINIYDWALFPFPKYWMIAFSTAIVVIIAAIYGVVAGAIVPFAACTISVLAFWDAGIISELVSLLILGVATGHYMAKFEIGKGGFRGLKIVDLIVVEVALAVIVWVFIFPLTGFYFRDMGLTELMIEGVRICGVSTLSVLCVVLPVLLLLNRVFKKRQDTIDARREYLYERNRS